MTILSEALLAIGIIMVSMAFVLVGGNIVGFQTSGLFQSSQNQISEEISDTIREMPDASAQFSTTYRPGVETYELQVQEGRTITADVPEAGSSSTEFLNYNIQNTVIRNAEEICIQKKSDQVTLERGRCASPDLDEFCENGRCINDICQPDRGETCANSGGDCKCPGDAESDDASSFCKPDYRAENFINAPSAGDGNIDTTGPVGCVNSSFVDTQSEGDKCSKEFECSGSLSCNSPHPNAPPGTTQSRCCPSGTYWNGSQCTSINTYDIYYVAGSSSYANSEDYIDRAEVFANSVTERTPFEQCSHVVDNNILQDTEFPNNGQIDLRVVITSQPYNGGCNAVSYGPGSGIVVIYKLGDAADRMVLPHEMGHEFGLCDEYDKGTYDGQNNDFPSGCGNPWPGDKGFYPANQCSNFNDGGTPAGTCGRDLDNDGSTKKASIMGGGAAWADSCGYNMLVNQPGLRPKEDSIDTGYENWLQEINDRGYQCAG